MEVVEVEVEEKQDGDGGLKTNRAGIKRVPTGKVSKDVLRAVCAGIDDSDDDDDEDNDPRSVGFVDDTAFEDGISRQRFSNVRRQTGKVAKDILAQLMAAEDAEDADDDDDDEEEESKPKKGVGFDADVEVRPKPDRKGVGIHRTLTGKVAKSVIKALLAGGDYDEDDVDDEPEKSAGGAVH